MLMEQAEPVTAEAVGSDYDRPVTELGRTRFTG
jgi:hypothetical protein